MGLIIRSTKNNKIKIKGYPNELEQVYCRVQMECLIDGVTLNVIPKYFFNKDYYLLGEELLTNLPEKIYNLNVSKQNIQTCLETISGYFTGLGYDVLIENNDE